MYNKMKSILGDIYMYKPKTFKVRNFTRLLYENLYHIFDKNKNAFTKMLLRELKGEDYVNKLDLYDFNQLIMIMVKQYSVLKDKLEIDEIRNRVKLNERIMELEAAYHKNHKLNVMKTLSFRISKEDADKIRRLKDKKVNEVIDLSIKLFILELDNETYELLLKTMRQDK